MNLPVFEKPSWLNDQDAATIHKRMMDALPSDIDKTHGGFPWDLTKPSALENAELLQFFLVETLKLMQPAWSYGIWLDLHAKAVNLVRRPANAAAGKLVVEGAVDTVIPQNFRFAVPAVGDTAAIEYTATKAVTIGANGHAEVLVTAVTPGVAGNAPAGAVTLMVTPLKGISTIRSNEPVTGGTEIEDDESLRQRIDEVNALADISYVGCLADYVRWAKEVPGIGTAVPIPVWDGPGTVKLIVVDTDGLPANDALIQAVYSHIMSPNDPMNRKVAIGVKELTVCAPTPKKFSYAVTLVLRADSTLETVVERFKAALQIYYDAAKQDGVLRYQKVGAELSDIPGVLDYRNLKINGGTANIEIARDEYPETEGVNASVGDGV